MRFSLTKDVVGKTSFDIDGREINSLSLFVVS
jgi:hypothetical protein